MNKELMKEEAMDRMNILKMDIVLIAMYSIGNIVLVSEPGIKSSMPRHLFGEERRIIKEWEEKHGCIVYHVINHYYMGNEMLVLLYVNDNYDGWDYDKQRLKMGQPNCYVINMDEPKFSEFGTCIVVPDGFGGVKRIIQ